MPVLFHLYFLNNFDLDEYHKNNECIIRDVAINNFIKNALR